MLVSVIVVLPIYALSDSEWARRWAGRLDGLLPRRPVPLDELHKGAKKADAGRIGKFLGGGR
jgi:hypothetical protein